MTTSPIQQAHRQRFPLGLIIGPAICTAILAAAAWKLASAPESWVPPARLPSLTAPSPTAPRGLPMGRCIREVLRAAPLSRESLELCRALRQQTASDRRIHAALAIWRRQCAAMSGVCTTTK